MNFPSPIHVDKERKLNVLKTFRRRDVQDVPWTSYVLQFTSCLRGYLKLLVLNNCNLSRDFLWILWSNRPTLNMSVKQIIRTLLSSLNYSRNMLHYKRINKLHCQSINNRRKIKSYNCFSIFCLIFVLVHVSLSTHMYIVMQLL